MGHLEQLHIAVICRHLCSHDLTFTFVIKKSVKAVTATWAVQAPILSRSSCLLVPTAWRPLVRGPYITASWVIHPAISNFEQKPCALASGKSHPGVIGTDIHTSLSAWCSQWRLSILTQFKALLLPTQISLYFLPEHSTKRGHTGYLSQHEQLPRAASECHGQESMYPCNWSQLLCDEPPSQF